MGWLPWDRKSEPEVPVEMIVADAVASAVNEAVVAATLESERRSERRTALVVAEAVSQAVAAATTEAVASATAATEFRMRAEIVQPMTEIIERLSQTTRKPGIYAFDHPIFFTSGAGPQTRPKSILSVDTMRRLADTYDVARSCINELIRQVVAVPLSVVPAPGVEETTRIKADIAEVDHFLSPDGGLGGRTVPRSEFERALFEDVLVIGAGAVWYAPDRTGIPTEVVTIDASTIRPVIDAYGYVPDKLAYEQWIDGVCRDSYTRQQLSYRGIYAQSYSPYYRSPIEWLVLTVQAALSADQWNLNWLVTGNTPSDLLAVPESWTPDQIIEFADYFNALLAGNIQERTRTRFVPSGSVRLNATNKTDNDFSGFMMWLVKRTCSIYGVSPASIGFASDQYKSAQGDAMSQTTQFGISALLGYRADFYQDLIRRLGYKNLVVQNVEGETEEGLARATRITGLVNGGIMTPNEARREEGLPPLPGADVLLVSSTVVPLEQAVDEEDQTDANADASDPNADQESGDEVPNPKDDDKNAPDPKGDGKTGKPDAPGKRTRITRAPRTRQEMTESVMLPRDYAELWNRRRRRFAEPAANGSRGPDHG